MTKAEAKKIEKGTRVTSWIDGKHFKGVVIRKDRGNVIVLWDGMPIYDCVEPCRLRIAAE